MCSGFCFLFIVNGSSGDNFFLVFQIFHQHILQVADLRLAVHQSQHDHGNAVLQLGMLIKPVEDDVGIGILFQFDDDSHAFPVGFIPNGRNTVHLLILYHLCNFFDQSGLIDLIRNFRHHNLLFSMGQFLDFRYRTDQNLSLSCPVCLLHRCFTHNHGAGRKIRTLYMLQQIIYRSIRVVDQFYGSVDHFSQIMRRDGCGHTYGDTVGTVYQQIRESGRQNTRFFFLSVKVRIEIHRFLFDIPQHLKCQRRHSGFRITHGGSTVSVHRTEVAVTVYQRIADIKRLCQTNHGIVN